MKQAAELDIMKAFRERLPDKPCPHCGKVLHQRTHKVPSGNVAYLPIYEDCDCEGAEQERQEAAAAKAEAERQRAENARQNTLHEMMAASGIRGRYADRTLDTYRVPPGDARAFTTDHD